MVIAYLDRFNLSVAITVDEFIDYLKLTDSDRGLLNSAFFWSYALMQIPAGWLVDRFGSKYPFALGFLLWSVVSGATALAHSARQLFALRLVLGVCESVVTPASQRWIRYHFQEKERDVCSPRLRLPVLADPVDDDGGERLEASDSGEARAR
jgi:ACS family D-galactonate transporter-like MFS transporter